MPGPDPPASARSLQVTIDEFRAAIEPHLAGGVSVEEGVRLAVARRGESSLVKVRPHVTCMSPICNRHVADMQPHAAAQATRTLWEAALEHRVIVLWAIWIFGGAACQLRRS